jgi:chromosome segregation ATPase
MEPELSQILQRMEGRLDDVVNEVRATREEARAAREEARAAHEEARAAHEEARAAHEEARAAHEEARAAHGEARGAREEARAAHGEARGAREEARIARQSADAARDRVQELAIVVSEFARDVRHVERMLQTLADLIGDAMKSYASLEHRIDELGEKLSALTERMTSLYSLQIQARTDDVQRLRDLSDRVLRLERDFAALRASSPRQD